MTITPRPEQEELIVEAIRAGLIHDPEEALDIAMGVLRHRLQPLRSTDFKPSLSDKIRDIWRDMPEEVRVALPSDGASQVDHYVYGLPKREQ